MAPLLLTLLLAAVASAHPALTGCPEGWSEYQGKCYFWSTVSTQLAYAGVPAACEALLPGAVPPSIHSDEQNTFLASLQTKPWATWIGLTKANSQAEFAWADGSPVDYLRWDDRQPETEHCAYVARTLDDERWNSYHCTGIFPYFCQIDM